MYAHIHPPCTPISPPGLSALRSRALSAAPEQWRNNPLLTSRFPTKQKFRHKKTRAPPSSKKLRFPTVDRKKSGKNQEILWRKRIGENQWKSMKIIENHWRSMKIDEKSKKINGKSMEINGNHWKSMESLGIAGNRWKSLDLWFGSWNLWFGSSNPKSDQIEKSAFPPFSWASDSKWCNQGTRLNENIV